MSIFSEKLKSIRKDCDITQEQLAKKLHVSRQAVSNWENDKTQPDIETLDRISEQLGIKIDELIQYKSLGDRICNLDWTPSGETEALYHEFMDAAIFNNSFHVFKLTICLVWESKYTLAVSARAACLFLA